MAEPYLFPVSILKDIEPWLTEYFAYQRFHIQPEIEQAFEAKYHRVEDFLKVNNEHINHIPHIHLAECDNQFLDKLEAIIKEELPEYNQTFRFGIGYGDLPLSQQGEFLKVLNAPKLIGLNVGKTDMMVPTKSVTAVIGLTTGEVSAKNKGCMSCNLKGTCSFRESGGHCNG